MIQAEANVVRIDPLLQPDVAVEATDMVAQYVLGGKDGTFADASSVMFDDPETENFGLFVDGVLKGVATVSPSVRHLGCTELEYIVVHPESQGRRLGKQLLHFVETYAESQGSRGVSVAPLERAEPFLFPKDIV